jgi:hypothetical protein
MKFVPAVKRAKHTRLRCDEDAEYRERCQRCVEDATLLCKGELRRLYAQEYNSMRGAIARAKMRGLPFDKRLRDLRNWLVHLGPKPHVVDSVDRVDVYKGYMVGNVRWASKYAQTLNRRVTKFQTVPGKGRMTTKQLATYLGLSYHTVYKRLQHGWSVERMLAEKPKGVGQWRWPEGADEARQRYLTRPKKEYYMRPLPWLIRHVYELMHDADCTEDNKVALQEIADELEQELHLLEEEERGDKNRYAEMLVVHFRPSAPPSINTGTT